jgi:outer membrane protein assembly factor BamB
MNFKPGKLILFLALSLILIALPVSSADDLEPPLQTAWKYRLGMADLMGHNLVQSIELIEDNVVYAKYGKKILAIDSENGKLLWSRDWTGGLAYQNDIVYVARSYSTSLYALDAKTGREIWKKDYPELDMQYRYDLVIYNDTLCIITKESYLNLQVLAVDTSGDVKWFNKYPDSPDYFDRPAVISDVMVLSYDRSYSGKRFVAVDIVTGETKWQIDNIPDSAKIWPYGDLFFICDLRENDNVYLMAVSKTSGETVWKKNIGMDRYRSEDILAVKDGKLVYIYETINVLNSENGEVLQEFTNITDEGLLQISSSQFKRSAVSDQVIYAATESDIYAIDLNTGEPLWKEKGKGGKSPYFYNSRIYLISWGKIYAYEHGAGITDTAKYWYFALLGFMLAGANLFVKRRNYNERLQNNLLFSSVLIFLIYFWFLISGLPVLMNLLEGLIPLIDTNWVIFLLIPGFGVITGTLAGKYVKYKFIIGMVAGAVPYLAALVISLILYLSEAQLFELLIWVPISLGIILIIGLAFGITGILLNQILKRTHLLR